MTLSKIKYLTSETAIKYIEDEVNTMKNDITKLIEEKANQAKGYDIKVVMAYVKYFLEHLDELLLKTKDPLQKASYFGVLFDKAPTYQELTSGTPHLAQYIKLNEYYRGHPGNLAEGRRRR